MDKGLRDTRPFAPFEWMLAGRYLRARRREGFISVISLFSFLGILALVGIQVNDGLVLVTTFNERMQKGATGQLQQAEAEPRGRGHVLEIGFLDLARMFDEQAVHRADHGPHHNRRRALPLPDAAILD